METNAPQLGAGRLSTAANIQPTNQIAHINATAAEILAAAQEIAHRLHMTVERLDGSRPVDSDQECAVDPPGQIGSIITKQTDTIRAMDMARQLLSDLEQLV